MDLPLRNVVRLSDITLSEISSFEVVTQLVDLFVLSSKSILQVDDHLILFNQLLFHIFKIVVSLIDIKLEESLLTLQLVHLLSLRIHSAL